MTVEALQDTLEGSGASTASVVERSRGSVTPVEDTETGHVMPEYPVSEPFPEGFNWPDDYEWPEPDVWPELGSATAGDERPGEPDEAWIDDPDAYIEEVEHYISRVYAHSKSSAEFVAALKPLFPDLREKVDRGLARMAEVAHLDDDELPDPDDDIAAGRGIIYLSAGEMTAALMAEDAELGDYSQERDSRRRMRSAVGGCVENSRPKPPPPPPPRAWAFSGSIM